MSELSSKDIAAWHRLEAKKYQDMANFHKKTADTIEPVPGGEEGAVHRYRKTHAELIAPAPKAALTLEQFEKALEEKGGRVNHIAARLRVSEDTIWNLLGSPQCKYAVGDRGFIYPKNPAEYERDRILEEEKKFVEPR